MNPLPLPARSHAARACLAAAALLVGNACFDPQTAGTTTTTGNTVSARVLLSDGRPAAGAEVEVRPSGWLPAGIPGSRGGQFSAEAFADSTGLFRVTLPAGAGYFLSVKSAGPGGSPEVHWREGITPATPRPPSAGPGDTVRLERAASLSGHVTGTADTVWLGFPGTSRFVRPGPDGSFSLEGLPPGQHDLRLIRSGAGGPQSLQVAGWTALSGQAMRLDTLSLPADPSIRTLSAPACLEAIDSLVTAPSPRRPSDPGRILRTILPSSPPEWVELDACLGSWSRLGSLPADWKGSFDLAAGPGKDYLVLPDSGWIGEIDTAGSRLLPGFPDGLALFSFQGGRYYAFFHADTVLRSFPDEAAWLAKTPDRAYPLPPGAFQRFAADGGGIHFLVPDGSGLALRRYDFPAGSFHVGATLHGFTGTCVGMAAGRAGEVWLLNAVGELHRLDGVTGALLSKIRIAAPHAMRGLAGPAE